MPGIEWVATLNSDDFVKSIKQIQNTVHEASKQVKATGMSIEKYIDSLKAKAAAVAAGFSAKQFVSQMVHVRGEFQQLEVSFRTMLGSEEKAADLMEQLTKTAAVTPFDLQGVANSAKQLLAYGIAAEDVNDTLVHLGDIAAGLSLPLGDLVYLYGTTMTQGRMFTQDLRQFQGRGIPIAEELAKQFGVAKEKVGELVTQGKVGAEEFKKAIMAMSSEGGKFAGLMDAQSKTITGQISNIEDAIDSMFNDLGKQSEGIINGTLGAVSTLVENYEKVGKALLGIVATYGTYKAAVITVSAVEKVLAALEAHRTAGLALQAAGIEAVTVKEMLHMKWIDLTRKAQELLNKTMLSNPYVLAATAVAGVAAALFTLSSNANAARETTEKLNGSFRDTQSEMKSEQAAIDNLFNNLRNAKDGTDEYKTTKDKILSQYGKYLDGLNTEIATLKNVEEAYKAITKAAREASLARGKEAALKDVQDAYGKTYAKNINDLQSFLSNRDGGDAILAEIQKELRETGTISKKLEGELVKYTGQQGYRGSFLPVAIQGLRNNEKYLNDYTKLVEQRFKVEDTPAAGQTRKGRTKANIEKDKKDAQAELDALTTIEAAGKKGLELRKKIAGYNKELEVYSPTATGKAMDARQKLMAEASKYSRMVDEFGKDEARRRVALSFSTAQAEIDAMKDGSEKSIAQISLDFEKRRTEIEQCYEDLKQTKIENARQLWEANPKNNGNAFDEKAVNTKYTKEETVNYEALLAANEASYRRALETRMNDEYNANREAINAYLLQYGDYAQKKQAIYDEANERICEYERQLSQEATEEGREAAQARIAIVKAETQAQVEELDQKYGKAKAFMIDLFGDASEKSVKEIDKIVKKYEALVKFIGGDGSMSREQLKGFWFTDADIERALGKLERGEITVKDFTDALKGLNGELAQRSPWQSFEKSVTKAVEKLKNAKGDTAKMGEGIEGIGTAVSDFAPQAKQFSSDIANIFGYDDSKVQSAIDGLEGLGESAAGVGQIMSGDIIGGVMTTASGISKVVSAFDGLFGADYSEYAKAKERYELLSSIWDELISKKHEYLSESWGTEATKAADEALRLLEAEREQNRIMAEARLDAGASAGSHSIAYRMWKGSYGYDGQNWRDVAQGISAALGVNFGSMEDMLDMTGEQLQWIKENYTGLWTAMDSDFRDALGNIIKFGETEKDILQKTKEQLTGTSFDNVFSGFMDALNDLASGSEDVFDDVAGNWEKMMNKMVLNNVFGTKYKKMLEKWYDQWEAAYSGDKALTSAEIAGLRSSYNDLIRQAADEVDALKVSGLIGSSAASSSDKSASALGLDKISYEQADQIEGQLTAIQIAQQQNGVTAQLILSNIQTLNSIASSAGSAVGELRNLAITRNEYLLDIKKSNRDIFDICRDTITKIYRVIDERL